MLVNSRVLTMKDVLNQNQFTYSLNGNLHMQV